MQEPSESHRRNRSARAASRFADTGLFRAVLSVVALVVLPLASLGQRVEDGSVRLTPRLGREPVAPPPAPPVQLRQARSAASQAPQPTAAPTLYSIGDPADEEQLFLEYINRARANPAAEAQRLKTTDDPVVVQNYQFFNVDLDAMVAAVSVISPAPPLSLNVKLSTAARLHSQDMLMYQYNGHYETNNGQTVGPNARVKAQGYDFSAVAENVFASVESVFHGHAAFEVDWGGGPSGMQSPPIHRENIHNPAYREIGIGLVHGTNGSVGPLLVTQDFATAQNATPFVTGVVFYDFNSNGFYDPGEGISGVTVTVSGADSYAVTTNSGGYSVPVPGSGDYTVTFTAPGLTTTQVTASVTNAMNVKIDFIPPYSPPVVSGPDVAVVGQDNSYQFTPLGAATAYQWLQSQSIVSTVVEGAENGLAYVTAQTSVGYQVVVTGFAASGTNAFHLAQPVPEPQTLTWNRTFHVGPDSKLEFKSRLGWATPGQVVEAQVSVDGGRTWQVVWTQAGDNTAGESTFQARSVSLAAFAGQDLNVRFVYEKTGLSYYGQTDLSPSLVGLLLDDLQVTAAEEVVNPVISDVPPGTSFFFNPASGGNYTLRVRAKVSNRYLAWGPAKPVTAQGGSGTPPTVKLGGIQVLANNQVQIDFELTSGAASQFDLEDASSPAGPFAKDNEATIHPIPPNQFRAMTLTDGAAQRFYRVSAR